MYSEEYVVYSVNTTLQRFGLLVTFFILLSLCERGYALESQSHVVIRTKMNIVRVEYRLFGPEKA